MFEQIIGALVQCAQMTLGLFLLRRLALVSVMGAALLFTSGLASKAQAHGLHASAQAPTVKADPASPSIALDMVQDTSDVACGWTCCLDVGCASAALIPAQALPAAAGLKGVFAIRLRPSIKSSPLASLRRPPKA